MIEYKLHSEYLEINEGNNPSFIFYIAHDTIS